ncbi:hypothetical protein [Sessilibacter corallicola]|uniref:hypothetical protein n=1 Tax=Sessilibacter corallicola TaxID=2904075 RepID=UPI002573DE47|nr:hypothetical protein [Sessilibacter corallicola]
MFGKYLGRSIFLTLTCLIFSSLAFAFDSGSTGSDGDFNPQISGQITLPESGILNYRTFTIPENVTISFVPNSSNTPAIILVQGDAAIDGTLDLSGLDGDGVGFVPPAAFAGGKGRSPRLQGGNGLGPGGASGGMSSGNRDCGGAGAGYLAAGGQVRSGGSGCRNGIRVGSPYGSSTLQPLVGGSGGGAGISGADSSESFLGAAGGSGGGALLLAVTGNLILNGEILGQGGAGGNLPSGGFSGAGGGSGGAVRIVATRLIGNGDINVNGGNGGRLNSDGSTAGEGGGDGSPGRVRIEVDELLFDGRVIPASSLSSSAPQPLFLADFPDIRISSIAGVAVPANPTGNNDVILPTALADTSVTIEFETNNVPPGSQVQLLVTPNAGSVTNVLSEPLIGTFEVASTRVEVRLPAGATSLLASVLFTPTEEQIALLQPFTDGQKLVAIKVSQSAAMPSVLSLHTVTGDIFQVPSSIIQ